MACKNCAFCGRSFVLKKNALSQKYCSALCAKDAERARDKERRQVKALARERKTCAICGTEFTSPNPRTLTCSPKCSAKLNQRNNSMKNNVPKKNVKDASGNRVFDKITGLRYNRKCHDCGRPTNDYRCAKCLQKWRNKNKVSGSGEQLESYMVGRSCR